MAHRVVRIAMWSGPRNISTALMRSWGSRPDTWVTDEPFYAGYLEHTGLAHPGRHEVLDHQERDWRAVVRELTGPVPQELAIHYQKQMAHHMLPHVGREWLDDVSNAFLIREPRAMLASLAAKIGPPTIEETGLAQQVELFRHVTRRTGTPPPVIDSSDVLRNPRRVLSGLCESLGVRFDDAMLRWEPGPRPTDGIWAPHWYHAVWSSTGFQPYAPKTIALDPQLETLAGECEACYAELAMHRLGATED